MLIVNKNVVTIKMTHNLAVHYMLHDLTRNTRLGNGSIIRWIGTRSFLKIGAIFADRDSQSVGKTALSLGSITSRCFGK